MAEPVQCANCGALLAKEDVFCGECGAPQPLSGEAEQVTDASSGVAPVAESSTPASGPPSSGPKSSDKTGWRVAVIVLLIIGIIVCLVGMVAFVIFASIESEVTTSPAEDWLYSAICCLLPISGTGTILTLIGAAIWYLRLRK
jgi:hypothetical protein